MHGKGWVSEGEKDPAAHWHEQSRVKAGLFLPQSAPLPVCQKHVSYPFPMIAGTAFDEDDLIFLQLTAPLFAASKAVWSPILENLLTQVSPLSLQAAVQDSPSAPQCHAKPPSASTSGTKHKNKKANKNASMMDFD